MLTRRLGAASGWNITISLVRPTTSFLFRIVIAERLKQPGNLSTMWARWIVPALLGLVSFVTAKSSTGNSVLVILEPKLEKDSFSKFFSGLEGAW